jgi:hypothetical protein
MSGAHLAVHPLAELFPLLDGAELDDLVKDVAANGVHEPIWIYEGKILDGRNRYRAAQEAGVECPLREYIGEDPVGFVVSLNLKRRHLNESQRSMVAAKLANLAIGDNQHSEGLPIGRASELLNVGGRSVARAKEVRDHGAPELQQAVERGGISVSAAADVATRPIDEQREIVARGEKEILEAAKAIRAKRAESRRAERFDKLIILSNRNAPLVTDRRFPIVYADPPWQYDHHLSASREIENHYPTLPIEKICALGVADICTPDAMLFLWVPAHSEKPIIVYEFIEQMYPDLPKIELFARSRRTGWDVWGNEVEQCDDLSIPPFLRRSIAVVHP